MNEAQTRKDLIDPAIEAAGWTKANSRWWDLESTPILLKRLKWLRNPFPVTGALGIWRMKPADARRLIAEL